MTVLTSRNANALVFLLFNFFFFESQVHIVVTFAPIWTSVQASSSTDKQNIWPSGRIRSLIWKVPEARGILSPRTVAQTSISRMSGLLDCV
jgi:hypothetical protein